MVGEGHGVYECEGVEARACESASDGEGAVAAGGGRAAGADDAAGTAADSAGPGGRRRGPRASRTRPTLQPPASVRAEGACAATVGDALWRFWADLGDRAFHPTQAPAPRARKTHVGALLRWMAPTMRGLRTGARPVS